MGHGSIGIMLAYGTSAAQGRIHFAGVNGGLLDPARMVYVEQKVELWLTDNSITVNDMTGTSWFGLMVKNIWPSGLYLFGLPVLAALHGWELCQPYYNRCKILT